MINKTTMRIKNGYYDRTIIEALSNGAKNKALMKITGLSKYYINICLKMLCKKYNRTHLMIRTMIEEKYFTVNQ